MDIQFKYNRLINISKIQIKIGTFQGLYEISFISTVYDLSLQLGLPGFDNTFLHFLENLILSQIQNAIISS